MTAKMFFLLILIQCLFTLLAWMLYHTIRPALEKHYTKAKMSWQAFKNSVRALYIALALFIVCAPTLTIYLSTKDSVMSFFVQILGGLAVLGGIIYLTKFIFSVFGSPNLPYWTRRAAGRYFFRHRPK